MVLRDRVGGNYPFVILVKWVRIGLKPCIYEDSYIE